MFVFPTLIRKTQLQQPPVGVGSLQFSVHDLNGGFGSSTSYLTSSDWISDNDALFHMTHSAMLDPLVSKLFRSYYNIVNV